MCIARARSFADRVLLNKVDLVSPTELEATRALVRGLNGTAKLFVTTRAHGVKLQELVGISAFDPARHAEEWGALEDATEDADPTALGNRALPSVDVAAHSISVAGEVDIDKFNEWITEVLRKRGDKIFRTKAPAAPIRTCMCMLSTRPNCPTHATPCESRARSPARTAPPP